MNKLSRFPRMHAVRSSTAFEVGNEYLRVAAGATPEEDIVSKHPFYVTTAENDKGLIWVAETDADGLLSEHLPLEVGKLLLGNVNQTGTYVVPADYTDRTVPGPTE
jgi:hypothetical protein